MNEAYKKMLEKQQYKFSGNHTAVKVCGWTKKALRGQGVCYKQKFYGINCHRCVQMAPSVNFCNFDCTFCWRDRYNEPYTKIDDPKKIVDESIAAHIDLLQGFKGNDVVDQKIFDQAMEPMHFAISLTGEPTTYPKLSEFIDHLHERNISTFLVTNGSFPDALKRITLPTQLYISLDAPDFETFMKVDRPSNPNSWEKLKETLDYCKEIHDKTRVCIRITLVKGDNDFNVKSWAELINRANPHFIEVKGYMYVGASQMRLSKEHQPTQDDIRAFCKELETYTDYKFIDEQESSKVVLMMKEKINQFLF